MEKGRGKHCIVWSDEAYHFGRSLTSAACWETNTTQNSCEYGIHPPSVPYHGVRLPSCLSAHVLAKITRTVPASNRRSPVPLCIIEVTSIQLIPSRCGGNEFIAWSPVRESESTCPYRPFVNVNLAAFKVYKIRYERRCWICRTRVSEAILLHGVVCIESPDNRTEYGQFFSSLRGQGCHLD